MENFFVDVIGSKTISWLTVGLTITLALVTGIGIWVKDIESKKDYQKLLVINQSISDKSADIESLNNQIFEKTHVIEKLQNEQKSQSEVIEYASKLANSPRVTTEWGKRQAGEPHTIKVINNDLKTFRNVRIGFLSEYQILAGKIVVATSSKPIYEEAIGDGMHFTPNAVIEAEVPEIKLNLENAPGENITSAKIVTNIIITIDEFVSVKDDPHRVGITTWLNRANNFKPNYGTTGSEPLFIHKELKYKIQSNGS
jgi:predicted RNase H-like nuclease (RuvC/YqgF family)